MIWTGASPAPSPPRHPARESDSGEILSGLYEGKTTARRCAADPHEDQRSKDYGNISGNLPPWPRRLHLHAENTLPRIARRRAFVGAAHRAIVGAGASPKNGSQEKYGIVIRGYMSALGPIDVPFESWDEIGNTPSSRQRRHRSEL